MTSAAGVRVLITLVELVEPAEIGCDCGTILDASSAPGWSVDADGMEEELVAEGVSLHCS